MYVTKNQAICYLVLHLKKCFKVDMNNIQPVGPMKHAKKYKFATKA